MLVKLVLIISPGQNLIIVSYKTDDRGDLTSNTCNKIISNQECQRGADKNHQHKWWYYPVEASSHKTKVINAMRPRYLINQKRCNQIP